MVTAWERPALLAEIESSHIRQYADFFEGSRDQVATLTGYTGNGVLLKLRAQHASATPIQVRNAADTLTVFEVNNATGLLLGGIQDGAISGAPATAGPSVAFKTSPGIGLYLHTGYGGAPYRIGVSTAKPNHTITLGPVPLAYMPYIGGIDVTLQASGTSTIDQVQAGITVTQGSTSGGTAGGPNPVRAQGPAVNTYSVLHMEGQERQGIAVTVDGASGPPGGAIFGLKLNVGVRGDYGASAALTARGVTGLKIYSSDDNAMTGPIQGNVVSGMLVASVGNRPGDLIQGMEMVVSTHPNITPTQRVGIILATEDGKYGRRGSSLDCLMILGRKGWPAGGADHGQVNVQPWVHGLMFGSGVGNLDGWPFASDSHAICFDHAAAADGAYNVVGTGWHLGSTGFATAVIGGGAGQWGNVFNFPSATVVNGGHALQVGALATGAHGIRFNTVTAGSYPIRVGTVFGVASNGYIGSGVADPEAPLDIRDPPTLGAFRFRGSNAISGPFAGAPGAVQAVNVYFWNGSAWQAGRIPIYP